MPPRTRAVAARRMFQCRRAIARSCIAPARGQRPARSTPASARRSTLWVGLCSVCPRVPDTGREQQRTRLLPPWRVRQDHPRCPGSPNSASLSNRPPRLRRAPRARCVLREQTQALRNSLAPCRAFSRAALLYRPCPALSKSALQIRGLASARKRGPRLAATAIRGLSPAPNPNIR
jgi:hypothetical protein